MFLGRQTSKIVLVEQICKSDFPLFCIFFGKKIETLSYRVLYEQSFSLSETLTFEI